MRGYCGIGIENLKHDVNLGTLWRSAHALGAAFIFTVGRRYERQASDTSVAYRHLPLFHFVNLDDLRQHVPHDCIPVAVEILPYATPLHRYAHPERALYLLGPEDGTLSRAAQMWCRDTVAIQSARCLNVAAAGTIVLYDRLSKHGADLTSIDGLVSLEELEATFLR